MGEGNTEVDTGQGRVGEVGPEVQDKHRSFQGTETLGRPCRSTS